MDIGGYYTLLAKHLIVLLYGAIAQYLLTPQRFSKRVTISTNIILFAVFSSLLSFVYLRYGNSALLKYYFFIIHIPSIIIFYTLSACRSPKFIFNFLFAFTVVMVADAIVQTIIFPLPYGNIIAIVIMAVFFAAVLFLTKKYIQQLFFEMLYTSTPLWFFFCLVPALNHIVMTIAVLYMVGEHGRSMYINIFEFCFCLITCAAYTVIFSLMRKTKTEMEQRAENDMMKLQLAAAQQQLDMLDEAEKQMSIYRHDMRFHLAGLSEMLKNGDIQGALELTSGIDKKIGMDSVKRYCPNKAVNAILSYYMRMAEENGIITSIDFSLPERFTIDVIDFTSMLANALENAINACVKIENPKNRFLKIKTICKTQFIMEISNTFDGIVTFNNDGLPVSADKSHGIGTRSISAFAAKNNAVIDFNTDDDWFKFRIAAPMSHIK